MKLYVCYGTWKPAPRPGGHPCGRAYHALRDAGYEPDVTHAHGLGMLPDIFNQTAGRREVKRLTGNNWVPVLVTDDDEVLQGSRKIEAWAKAHPASAAGAPADGPAPGADAPAPTDPPAATDPPPTTDPPTALE